MAAETIENLVNKSQIPNRILLKIEGPQKDITQKLRQISGILNVREEEPISDNTLNTLIYVLEFKDEHKDIFRDLLHLISSNNWILKDMEVSKMSMEEFFLKSIK